MPGVLSQDALERLAEDAKNYDYIRFSWPDMNGIARGKTLPSRHASDAMFSGIACYSGKIKEHQFMVSWNTSHPVCLLI